jgi:hypothetical protein
VKPRYSGDKSRKFWARINALPDSQHSKAYSLGVVLQNVEGDILRMLDLCEREAKADE